MFGYIVVNQNELKIKDYDRYRSHYCGLCHCLKKGYGRKAQVTLSYDMTFLDIILNAMYEEPLVYVEKTCLTHPMKKQKMRFNDVTNYVADMSVMLTYYKLIDDWKDDRDVKSRALAGTFKKCMKQLEYKYPSQGAKIRKCISLIFENEANDEHDIDLMAGLSGKLFETVFEYRDDEWSRELRAVGFFLGKFVYLLDAYDDLAEDLKKGRYNVWEPYMNRRDFDAYVENMLTLMITDCAKAFEKLPIVQDIDILRNIIYSGVWTKYNLIKEKETKELENDR